MTRSPKIWIAATWLIAFCFTFGMLWPLAMLFDSDSCYHLAVAREYAQRGIFSDLTWARFSVMRHGFGDKELLFHLLIAPFTLAIDPVLSGKLVIAGLTASTLATLAALILPWQGAFGLWLPMSLLLGSLAFDLRTIRLRPELLALLLLLWTLRALLSRRYVRVTLLAAVFALSYTAVHALVGVCALCFVVVLLLERRAEWGLVLCPLLGALAGLALHPHFPHNLEVFYLQNVQFWRFQHNADMGTEIRSLGIVPWLRGDWPLLAAVLMLLASLERGVRARPELRETAWCLTAVALVACAGFAHSARFAVYALPLSLLAVAAICAHNGWQLGPRLSRLGAHAPRTWLPMGLLWLVTAPLTAAKLEVVLDRGGCVWAAQRWQLENLGRAIPSGAKVAATWSAAEDYVYFAPQGRYLNLLDPVFMRAANPAAYEAQHQLFAGELDDVPLALVAALDSDYVAFNAPSLPRLYAQLSADPRVRTLLAGGHALFHVERNANAAFVLDFRVAASREAVSGGDAQLYPRSSEPRARATEAFVDVARVAGAGRCVWFSPVLADAMFELDANAAMTVWSGNEKLSVIPAQPHMTVGSGHRLRLSKDVQLEICSDARAALFYVLRRD